MTPLRSLRNLRPSDVERLVDAIERSMRGGAPPATPPPAPAEDATPQGPPARQDAIYGEALRFFGARERELRDHAKVSERVLGQLRAELPTMPQQLLLLRAPAGGVAGGRVRIRNAATSPARFAFHPRFDQPAFFHPRRFNLAPGESQVVDVRIDLLSHDGRPGQRLTFQVDVLADGRAALKLWIEVELDRPAEAK